MIIKNDWIFSYNLEYIYKELFIPRDAFYDKLIDFKAISI